MSGLCGTYFWTITKRPRSITRTGENSPLLGAGLEVGETLLPDYFFNQQKPPDGFDG